MGLWDCKSQDGFEVSDDWRDKASEFISDKAAVKRMSDKVREFGARFNLTETSGKALVDLLIQAHLGDAADQYKRMRKQAAEKFDVKRTQEERARDNGSGSLGEGNSGGKSEATREDARGSQEGNDARSGYHEVGVSLASSLIPD